MFATAPLIPMNVPPCVTGGNSWLAPFGTPTHPANGQLAFASFDVGAQVFATMPLPAALAGEDAAPNPASEAGASVAEDDITHTPFIPAATPSPSAFMTGRNFQRLLDEHEGYQIPFAFPQQRAHRPEEQPSKAALAFGDDSPYDELRPQAATFAKFNELLPAAADSHSECGDEASKCTGSTMSDSFSCSNSECDLPMTPREMVAATPSPFLSGGGFASRLRAEETACVVYQPNVGYIAVGPPATIARMPLTSGPR